MNLKNIVIGAVMFASAFVSSVLSVLIVIKGMEKVWPIVSNGKLVDFISNDTIWLTLLILIIWCIDLLVRPLIKDLMQGFLKKTERKLGEE